MLTSTALVLTQSSIIVSWETSNSSITDGYIVSYIRFCDNIEDVMFIEDGASNSTTIDKLHPGHQYSISIAPYNILGKGMERTVIATVEGSGKFM